MSSQLNAILNKIGDQLSNSGIYKDNYSKNQNKKDLSFYSEQLNKDSSHNLSILSDINFKPSQKNSNSLENLNNEQVKDNTEVKKKFEREMQPFINKIKKDLNQLIQNFRTEFKDYHQYKKDINLIKKSILENKNICNEEKNDKSIKDLNDKVEELTKKINLINSQLESSQKNSQSQMHLNLKESQNKIYKNNNYIEIENNDIQPSNDIMSNAQLLYNALNEKLTKCEMDINELNTQTSQKIMSLDNKIANLSSKSTDWKISDQPNENKFISNSNFLLEELKKYNNIHEITVNKIGEQALLYDKEIEEFKRNMNSFQKDISSYDENFEHIQRNFDKINNQIEKNDSVDKDIKTLSEKQDILQKKMENLIDKSNEIHSKTIDELRSEFNSKLDTLKANKTSNSIFEEYVNKFKEFDDQLKIKLINKAKVEEKFEIQEKRIDIIENEKIPELYAYIDKRLNSFEGANVEKQFSIQEKILPIANEGENLKDNDNNYLKENKEYKDENDNDNDNNDNDKIENFDKFEKTLYEQGPIHNKNNKAIFQGNGTDKPSNEIDNSFNKKTFMIFNSEENKINENYAKNDTDNKGIKNQEYIKTNPAQLIASKSDFFGKSYLKNFVIPQHQSENIIEIYYEDSNIHSSLENNENDNEQFANFQIGDEPKEYDEEISKMLKDINQEDNQEIMNDNNAKEEIIINGEKDFDFSN